MPELGNGEAQRGEAVEYSAADDPSAADGRAGVGVDPGQQGADGGPVALLLRRFLVLVGAEAEVEGEWNAHPGGRRPEDVVLGSGMPPAVGPALQGDGAYAGHGRYPPQLVDGVLDRGQRQGGQTEQPGPVRRGVFPRTTSRCTPRETATKASWWR